MLRKLRKKLRKKFRKVWKSGKPLAINPKSRQVDFLLPARRIEEVLPSAGMAPVTLFPRLLRDHPWAMPEHELLVLGAVTRVLAPRRIVELGTFMGGSTLVMAANAPEDARIITYDLPPDSRLTHRHGLGVGLLEFDVGALFRGTPFENSIEQRFVNLAQFDGSVVCGMADLVFVDADHTYEFAARDTRTAYTMLRPGGCIVWHDYTWAPENAECIGVTRAVHEFYAGHPSCYQIAGTRFAIFLDHRPDIAADGARG